MKLLVISTLKWRMNPLTPISFLDHIVRRLGLTDHVHWDFFKKYEVMILCVVSVLRFVCYKRSVLGIATMLHVVDEIDPPNCIDYKSQLLDFLKTTKDGSIAVNKVRGTTVLPPMTANPKTTTKERRITKAPYT